MENVNFTELLKYTINDSISSYHDNELAFLALQGKIENLLRDKIAWLIDQNLNPNGSREYFVRKEYNPLTKYEKCNSEILTKREKCDLAILNTDKTPICLIEFKAAFWGEHEKKEYLECCTKDCEKMRSFSTEAENTTIPKYYIVFSTYHNGDIKCIENHETLISYTDIVTRSIKKAKGNLPYDNLTESNNPWIDIPEENNSYTQNGKIVEVLTQKIGKYYGLDVGIVTMILKVND